MKAHVWLTKRKGKHGYRYAVQWCDPRTGQRKTESVGSDRAYARQCVAERRRELLTGLYREITAITWDDFVTEHLRQLESSLSEGSYVEHERTLRQFKATCNPKDLTIIDFQLLEKFRTSRVTDGVSPATVNKCLRTLQSAFERAVKRGYLKVNPFKGNRRALWLKEPEPVPTILEPEDFQALLNACQDDRWKAICTIGYYTGLRRGEIVALEWQDIDFESGILHVHNKEDHTTKSGKNRSVPMTSQVITALQALRVDMFQSKYVFKNTAGRPMFNNFFSCFERIVKRAGLVDDKGKPLFSVHDLRRSCATELLRRGVAPKTVQRILGHADLSTTMKYYAAVKDKDLRDAIQRLEETA